MQFLLITLYGFTLFYVLCYRAEMTTNTTDGSANVQPCNSKETQTDMTFPQHLKISVPIHCATVKAAKEHNNGGENIPKDGDEWLSLTVSILDTSSETPVPLPCVVALQGDEHIGPTGQVVCFLSLSVDAVEDHPQRNAAATRSPGRMYYSERSGKSKYTPNGKATFRLCFFQSDTNYIISLKIHSIYDKQGIEYVGYTVEHYMGFISAVCTVERNAFKAPPLLKYEGPIATNKFRKLMEVYTKLFYQGRREESNVIMSKITSSDRTKLDVKLYMSMSRATEKPFDPQSILQVEEFFQKSQSLDSRNGFLLQALAMMCLSQMHVLQGKTDRALDCIHHSRSLCLEIAPSHLTSCVFFNYARILINEHKGNVSPSIKRRILELLDRAIAHSYYGIGWERVMIFDTHYHKAMFCLNGVLDFYVKPDSNYTPTEEDISLAEQHLNTIPPDLASTVNMYKVMYYTARSDLNKWKGNIESARKYAEKAKQVCAEREYLANLTASLETRLQQLKPDIIDEILDMYEDHI